MILNNNKYIFFKPLIVTFHPSTSGMYDIYPIDKNKCGGIPLFNEEGNVLFTVIWSQTYGKGPLR